MTSRSDAPALAASAPAKWRRSWNLMFSSRSAAALARCGSADFGLSPEAQPLVEHRFRTGDRVDVMFANHEPERTVVEIEVSGEDNVCTGIHQAIKYRSLAEAEGGYDLLSPRVRSLVVAYETNYPQATSLASRYAVDLKSVDANLVLALAG